MGKKNYIIITILKTLLQVYFISLVYQSALFADCNLNSYAVIGQFFLLTLAALIISGIAIDIISNILLSFHPNHEKEQRGEWENYINRKTLQVFSYSLSAVLICIMLALAIDLSVVTILLVIRIAFIVLISSVSITKMYYYQ